VVNQPTRGEVWWGELPDAGRRPFLVLTREVAIPVLHSVLVVPVTRTIRGIPTELRLHVSDGMPKECAASFDNVRVVPKANLVERICVLDQMRMAEACLAARTAIDC
jgi:mRNA interferase MazF